MIRVAVVDDQPLLVSAFSALVDAQPDMQVVATASNGQGAIDAARAGEIDVMLMDIRMPGVDGIAATTQICTGEHSRPRVLVLTTFNVDDLVLGALAAGARGFLLKDAEPSVVLDAIRAVDRGEAVIDPQAAPVVLDALRTPTPAPMPAPTAARQIEQLLTARELEVLRLIAAGRTNAELATDLFIAETTVKTHVGNLLMKLHARDRVALVVLAHGAGLVSADGPIILSQ